MNLIISHNSPQPIYEQIVNGIKDKIIHAALLEGAALPSVRTLAKDLRISALTVKKAYDQLEAEGFVITVHGKGSFVAGVNHARLLEEDKKELEAELERVIRKARCRGLDENEIRQMFELMLSED